MKPFDLISVMESSECVVKRNGKLGLLISKYPENVLHKPLQYDFLILRGNSTKMHFQLVASILNSHPKARPV